VFCCAGTWHSSTPNRLPGLGRLEYRILPGADAMSSVCPHGQRHEPVGGPGDGGRRSQAQRRGYRTAEDPHPRAMAPVAPQHGGVLRGGRRRGQQPLPGESHQGRRRRGRTGLLLLLRPVRVVRPPRPCETGRWRPC
jgi:hypothetical protein